MECPSCGPEFTPPPGKIPAPAPKPAAVRVSEHVVEFERMEFGGYDWLVLEKSGGKALLLYEKALEYRVYYKAGADITWENCDLRADLNGEFYNHFNANDRARIAETRVVNDNNPWFGTAGGDTTADRIFLLSLEEAVKYFGDSGKLRRGPTDDEKYGFNDQYNSARMAYETNRSSSSSPWWLRSPGGDSLYAAIVAHDGYMSVYGLFGDRVCRVRPAIWITIAEAVGCGKGPEPQPQPAPVQTSAPAPLPASSSVKAGGKMQFGGYDWFVPEVSGGKALLFSEKILEYRAYHNEWVDITWAQSDLRAFLNGEFYDSFTVSDRARIAETRVVNDDNQWYGTPGGDDTYDRIFLLSLEEVAKFFGNSEQLRNRPSDALYIKDRYDSVMTAYDTSGKAWAWWLRSLGNNSSNAASVSRNGDVYVGGNHVNIGSVGVRPAMWITL
uniref:DUF6273 domain-containing protein n=1 Tax=uncultured bacterium contig00034 TaxID=1181523 RepID=A0A806KC43_9BACT|nr:hypothetical protein [uncultured bacterium contig00034]